ncbi:MAG TPA: FAD:protein FMN transferase [Rhizomicrobium sp.]|jgi:thiamine biosynthesis lipoprotein
MEIPLIPLTRSGEDFLCQFQAMATPCEVRVETADRAHAGKAAAAVMAVARRIEDKYSRYRDDSVTSRINHAGGQTIAVDKETARLLDFAAQCFEISDGLFDITSGVLRRAWTFDGSDRLPDLVQVEALRALVGWDKATWRKPYFTLPEGMEIDFGGLAKEYAVDRALAEARMVCGAPMLVNFGGDLAVSGPRSGERRWHVAIASVERDGDMAAMLDLAQGGLATSGDARRYLLKDGVRYSHILDPRTGWPVRDAPRSVTVAAASCVEAGLTATLAMLHGAGAEKFLEQEGMRAWCIR